MFGVDECGNLAYTVHKSAFSLKTKYAVKESFFSAVASGLADDEWLSPDCLQSNKQQNLDTTDSGPLLCAARQQDAAQPASPSKWGLTPASELTVTEAIKPAMSSSLDI
jgi:hypothetical protein